MSFASLSTATRLGGIVWAISLAVFAGLWFADGFHETAMAVPAAIGWAAAIYALRPIVPRDKTTGLYFAFGVMAFLMFFLHETYEYEGAMRYFPLIVGWTGVFFSVLDIISLTDTRPGHLIANFFGSALEEPPDEGRRASREILCIAGVAGGVALVWLLGFLVAAPIYVFLWMWWGGRKTVLKSIYGGIGSFVFIWLLFEVALSYELYQGVLIEWLLEDVLAS